MTFRLHIPGREFSQPVASANAANPLIDEVPISGLAALAANNVFVVTAPATLNSGLANLAPLESFGTAVSRGAAEPLPILEQADCGQSTFMIRAFTTAEAEQELAMRRHASIVWLGYAEPATDLAEMLRQRDRELDERRLCVECAHAGPNWTCSKQQGFLLDVLRRCEDFQEGN